jgi:hypothetical protein
MMTKYFERIIDITTGEETIRPYSDEEIAAVETERAEIEIKLQKSADELAAKDAARQVILDKLGLTQEEASLLLS